MPNTTALCEVVDVRETELMHIVDARVGHLVSGLRCVMMGASMYREREPIAGREGVCTGSGSQSQAGREYMVGSEGSNESTWANEGRRKG
eukprot:7866437-Pyramimonas_sp.AAC.3